MSRSEQNGQRRSLHAAFALLAPIALLLPFAGKPLHIDDTFYVWVARQIVEAPLDFYGFETFWGGRVAPAYEVDQNPPGASYLLALAGGLGGFREVPLHASAILLAGLVGLGVYLLASRWTRRPGLATAVALCCPAFLVSATTLMADVPMLAFYVWGILLWVVGIERRRSAFLASGAVLLGIAILTKYPGIAAVPLAFAYALLERRRPSRPLLFLVAPIAMLLAYQAYADHLYGSNLVANAARFSLDRLLEPRGPSRFERLLMGLTFTGGGVASAFLLGPLFWSRRTVIAGVALAASLGLLYASLGHFGRFPLETDAGRRWGYIIQCVLFTLGGVQVLGLCAGELRRRRTPESALLVLWTVGTFGFASLVNWSVNVRSVLPMIPAVGLLAARRIDDREREQGPLPHWKLGLSLGLALALSLVVARADQRQAQSVKSAAALLSRQLKDSGREVFFKGHWGFQYYMEEAGIPHFDPRSRAPLRGDRVVMPLNNVNLQDVDLDRVEIRPAGRVAFAQHAWVTVMHRAAGAGFYHHSWGPLPYVFGPAPDEVYVVFDFVR